MEDLEDSEEPGLSTTLALLSRPCSVFIAGAVFVSLAFAVLTFKLSRLLRERDTDAKKQPIAWLSQGCVSSFLGLVLCLVDTRQSYYSHMSKLAGNGIFSKTYDKIVSNNRHSMRRTIKYVDNGTVSACRMLNDRSMDISNGIYTCNKNEKHNPQVTCSHRQFLVFKGCVRPLEVSTEVTQTQSTTAKYGVNILTSTKKALDTYTSVSTTHSRSMEDLGVYCESVFCETSQTSHTYDTTSQSSHTYDTTSQTIHRDAVTSQTSYRDAATSQTSYRDAVTSQTSHGDAATSQTSHGDAATSQTSYRDDATSWTSHSYGATSLSTYTALRLGRRVPVACPTTSMIVETRCKIPLGPLSTSVSTSAPKPTRRPSVCDPNKCKQWTSWILPSASLNNDNEPGFKTHHKKMKTHNHVTLLSHSMEMLHKCRKESVSQYGKSTNALLPCLCEEKKNDQRKGYFHIGSNEDIHKQRRITYRQCSAARPPKHDVPTFVLHTGTAPSGGSNIDSKSRRQQQRCTTCHCSNMIPCRENEPHTLHGPRGSLFASSNELKQLIQTTITDMQKYKTIQATKDKTEAGLCHHPPYMTQPASNMMCADNPDICQTGKQRSGMLIAGHGRNLSLDKHAENYRGPISSPVSSHNNGIQQTEACLEKDADNVKHNSHGRRLEYTTISSQNKTSMKTVDNCSLNVDTPCGTKFGHIQVNDPNNHVRQNDPNNHIHNKFGLQDVFSKPLEHGPDEGEGCRSRPSCGSRCFFGICSSKPSDAKQEHTSTCRQKAGDCTNPFVATVDNKGVRPNQYLSNSKSPQVCKNSAVYKIASPIFVRNKLSNTEIQIDALDNLAYAISRIQHLKPGRRRRTHRSILEGEESTTTYNSQSSHADEVAHQDLESSHMSSQTLASTVYPVSNNQYRDLKKPHRNNSHRDPVISSIIKWHATGKNRRFGEVLKCTCHKTRLKTRKQLSLTSNSYEKSTTTPRDSLSRQLGRVSVSPRKSNKFLKNTENRSASQERIDLQNDIEYATKGISRVCCTSSRCKRDMTQLSVTGYKDRNCSTVPCEANAIPDAFIFLKCKNNSSESAMTNSTRCTSAASVYVAQIMSSASAQGHYSTGYRLEDKHMLILGTPDTSGQITGQVETSHLYYRSQSTSSDLHPLSRHGRKSPPPEVVYSSNSPSSVGEYGGNSQSSESHCCGNSQLLESQRDGDSSIKVHPYIGDCVLSACRHGGNILPTVEYDGSERGIGDMKQPNNILPSRDNVSETKCKSYDSKRLNGSLLDNKNFPVDQRRKLAGGKKLCHELNSTLKHKARVRFKQSLEEIDNEEYRNNTDKDITAVTCREFLEGMYDHSVSDDQYLRDGDKTEYSSDMCMITSTESLKPLLISEATRYAETKLNNISPRVHVRRHPRGTDTPNKAPSDITFATSRQQLVAGIRSPSPITLDSEQISYLEIIPKNGRCPGFRLSELNTTRMPIEGKLIRPNKTPRYLIQRKRNRRIYPRTITPSLSSSSMSQRLYTCRPVWSMAQCCVPSSTSNAYPSTLTESSSTSLQLGSDRSAGLTLVPSGQAVVRDAGDQHRILHAPENTRSAGHACHVPHNTLAWSRKATLGLVSETGCSGATLIHADCKSQDWVVQRNSQLMHVACGSENIADKLVGMNVDKQVSCNIQDEMADKDAQTSTHLNEQHKKSFNLGNYAARKFSHIALGVGEKDTLQQYLSSSAHKEAGQDKLDKAAGDSLTRTTGQSAQPIVDLSRQKVGSDPASLDNKRKVESPMSKHTAHGDDSGFVVQLQVNNSPNRTSHITLEKRCSNKQCSGFQIQDLIRVLQVLGPHSQSDVKDYQTESLHRQLHPSMCNVINTENKIPNVNEKSVQCTQKITVRPKLKDVLKHKKKKKPNRLKRNSSISKTSEEGPQQPLKHTVSPEQPNIIASAQSNMYSVSLSCAAGRNVESRLDRVHGNSEHIHNNDNVCPTVSGQMLRCELCNRTEVSGEPREHKKPPLKLTHNDDIPDANVMLKAKKYQETCLQSRDKLYHPAHVKTLTLPEKGRLDSADESHNLGSNIQTMPWSDTHPNNKLKCKTLSVTNTSDCNTEKHQTLLTEAGNHDCATSSNNYLIGKNDKVFLCSKSAFKSRIPVPISHTKAPLYPRLGQQPVKGFSKIVTHNARSDNNFPNLSGNYRNANGGTHVSNRKANVACGHRDWNPRLHPPVTTQTSRVCTSNNNPVLPEQMPPIKKQYTCSTNNRNRIWKTGQSIDRATSNIGAAETCQSVNRYYSSNNCHRPARDCSNHTFTKDINGQKKFARSKPIRVKETAKQRKIDTLPGTVGEPRRNVRTVDIPHRLYGHKPIRTYVRTEEDRTEGAALTSTKRSACNKLRVSSRHKVKPARLHCCNSNQQPGTATGDNNIQIWYQMSQQIPADCGGEGQTWWGVDGTISDRYKANMFGGSNKIPPNATTSSKVAADKANMTSPVQAGILVEEQNINTDSDLNKVVSHPILDLSILPSAVYKRNHIGLCSDLESDCPCFLSWDHAGENCTLCNSVNLYETSRTKSTGSKLKRVSTSHTCNFGAYKSRKQAQKLNIQDMKTKMPQESRETNASHSHDNCTDDSQIDSLLRLSPETDANSLEEMKCSIKDNVKVNRVTPAVSQVSNTNTLSWVCISTTDDVSAAFVFDFPSHSLSHNIQR